MKKLILSASAVAVACVLINAMGTRVANADPVAHSNVTTGNLAVANHDPAPVVQTTASAPVPTAAAALAANVGNASELDERRQLALGMIETGNDDNEIGGAGEVSRYQIMPSVWKHYSQSSHYQNPAVSLAVARSHWTSLYNRFKQQAQREPTDFDMYVLWNTRYGYYARKGFNPSRLNTIVRDRAQRFVNLVQRTEE
jgi:hypothetical protein